MLQVSSEAYLFFIGQQRKSNGIGMSFLGRYIMVRHVSAHNGRKEVSIIYMVFSFTSQKVIFDSRFSLTATPLAVKKNKAKKKIQNSAMHK